MTDPTSTAVILIFIIFVLCKIYVAVARSVPTVHDQAPEYVKRVLDEQEPNPYSGLYLIGVGTVVLVAIILFIIIDKVI